VASLSGVFWKLLRLLERADRIDGSVLFVKIALRKGYKGVGYTDITACLPPEVYTRDVQDNVKEAEHAQLELQIHFIHLVINDAHLYSTSLPLANKHTHNF
jgi:hypothetical protein